MFDQLTLGAHHISPNSYPYSPINIRRQLTAVLLDVDGVVRNGDTAIAGAGAALAALRRSGRPFAFTSNNTRTTADGLAAQLRGIGIDVDASEVVTAGTQTALYLNSVHPGARCLFVGEGMPFSESDGVVLVDGHAEVVIVGGYGPSVTFDRVNAALHSLEAGASLIAMHRSLRWLSADGPALDAGGLVAWLEQATGTGAVTIGKPSPKAFEFALSKLGARARGSLMVGDDLANDVLAAQRLGMRGVLVLSGKTSLAAVSSAAGAPDHVLPSIAALPQLLNELGPPGPTPRVSHDSPKQANDL